VALPFTLKKYLKAKEEELWKLKYFTMQRYNLPKNLLKETKILQDIQNSITKSQVSTQAKISSFKNPHIKIDLLLPRGPKSLKLLYTESKHNILLALVDKANKRDCITLGGHNA